MKRPEQDLHKAVAAYLRVALREPAFFTTFPAGGGGKVRGAQLKAMGLLPGMPDILIFWASGSHGRVLGIELKSPRGRSTPEQDRCADRLHAVNMDYCTCRSIPEVEWYLREHRVPVRVALLVPVEEAA